MLTQYWASIGRGLVPFLFVEELLYSSLHGVGFFLHSHIDVIAPVTHADGTCFSSITLYCVITRLFVLTFSDHIVCKFKYIYAASPRIQELFLVLVFQDRPWVCHAAIQSRPQATTTPMPVEIHSQFFLRSGQTADPALLKTCVLVIELFTGLHFPTVMISNLFLFPTQILERKFVYVSPFQGS